MTAFQIGDLEDLTLDQARNLAELNNYQIRVTKQNGNSLIVTMDYRTNRINVWIEDNIVIHVVGIG